jgi:hypothetical protein
MSWAFGIKARLSAFQMNFNVNFHMNLHTTWATTNLIGRQAVE